MADVAPGAHPRHRRSAFGRLVEAANTAGSLWLCAVMVLINVDVVGRAALNRPIRGVAEMVSLSIVGIVFLQLAHALRAGRFIRSDLLIERLTTDRPRVGDGMRALYDLLGLALLVIVIWFGVPNFVETWEAGDYMGAIGVFTVPVWPVVALILLGAGMTAVQYALDFLYHGRRAVGRSRAGADGSAGPSPHRGGSDRAGGSDA